jgi:hypothetical protein
MVIRVVPDGKRKVMIAAAKKFRLPSSSARAISQSHCRPERRHPKSKFATDYEDLHRCG